jgi:peroxiredoxin
MSPAEITPEKDNIVKDVSELRDLYETIIPVGSKAPSFKLKTIDGKEFDSSDYIGEDTTLLYFWSVFCPYCKKSLPEIDIISEKYKLRGLKVIAVNLDGIDFKKAIEIFLKEKKVKVDVPLDALNKSNSFFTAADPYGVNQTPSVFLVNEDGEIIYTAEYDVDYELLEEKIEQNTSNKKEKLIAVSISAGVLILIAVIIYLLFFKKKE